MRRVRAVYKMYAIVLGVLGEAPFQRSLMSAVAEIGWQTWMGWDATGQSQ